jgi:uncharacterized membrane protein
MRNLLLVLHVVAAIFLVGPLAAVANQAARALRNGDSGVLRNQSRLVTIYGWASLVVGLLGAALVRGEWGATFGEAWVIASLVLFMVASALLLGLLAPLLRRAAGTAESGHATGGLAARAAPLGGIVSLCYVAIAVLMVYQPGG